MLTVLPLPDVLASLPIEFRTVAGIVASPMLEIIRVQWHLLLGVTHALLREMILGFSTEVVLLYYHCKYYGVAALVVTICAEIENGVTFKESSSMQSSSPKSRSSFKGGVKEENKKPKIQKISMDSKEQQTLQLPRGSIMTTAHATILPRSFIKLIPEILPGFVLTLIRIITSFIRINTASSLASNHGRSLPSFKGSPVSYPILNLLIATMLALATYPIRDFVVFGFVLRYVVFELFVAVVAHKKGT
mmetsp:Transcript_1901/g.2742  ORF Transcript_1901/g.2742 Transcript_1901/m.2742 type:complete len:247 (+) Transcript_1901:483-1223(+)|eukprot:CAMPEP_0185272406 /NCGR_PEP_ID=MMETSP1359-20130426/47103_1 /TAXON_ID=552665 /ORGANISM="Bigelowiella longifila, Strain CCMP242" /LENGTH=246 /DNA_ID=CAMNT_0027864661 /DNA_START=439 /DNA_END=1179 /DNA_ORIENTATION=+